MAGAEKSEIEQQAQHGHDRIAAQVFLHDDAHGALGIGATGIGLRRSLGASVISRPRLYETSAFTNAFRVNFDLRRTRKSGRSEPGSRDV